ncbi:MAG: N-acetylmuramoyl-L-alanine amidase [Planctomycetota bacterium]|nr:N-acetylmuramoyl-L-alanine amidase [Planctomycetota bacterium]
MSLSRREFLAGLGLLMASGCTTETQMSDVPPPIWPGDSTRPHPAPGTPPRAIYAPPSRPLATASGTLTPPQPLAVTTEASPTITARTIEPEPAMRAITGGLQAIPRSKWADAGPVMTRINPMGGVSRITIHHEGWKLVTFADAVTTAERIELDRRSHLTRLGAGDIAYHYVIDRAGRVWQGRDIRYQGAHVAGENEHNLGIMVLGNFDIQTPTDAQLTTLNRSLAQLTRSYGISPRRVFTHQELNPTACPGVALQPRIVSMRNRAFA